VLVYSLHCLHNTILYVYVCVHTRRRWRLSVQSYICVQLDRRETTARLLSFFSFLFFLFYSTSKHTLLLSLIRCENKNNCIFLVVQYLPINCSQINHPDARQLNATVTDGFDKHTRGTFEQCLMASKIE